MKTWQRATSFFATAAVAVAAGVFVLAGVEPQWWAGLIAIVVPVLGAVLGKPWKPPEA